MPRSKFAARAAARQTSRPSVGFAIIRKRRAWAAGSSSRSERGKRGGSSIRLTKLGPSFGPRWRRSGGSDDSSRAAVTSRQKPRSPGQSRAARRIGPSFGGAGVSFFAAFKVHISWAFGGLPASRRTNGYLFVDKAPRSLAGQTSGWREIALAFGLCNQSHTSPEFLRRRHEPRTTPSVADARTDKETSAAA
jgi:hypothetical protein